MVPAVYQQKKIEIQAGDYQLGVSGSTLLFDGHLAVDPEKKEEEQEQMMTGSIKINKGEPND